MPTRLASEPDGGIVTLAVGLVAAGGAVAWQRVLPKGPYPCAGDGQGHTYPWQVDGEPSVLDPSGAPGRPRRGRPLADDAGRRFQYHDDGAPPPEGGDGSVP